MCQLLLKNHNLLVCTNLFTLNILLYAKSLDENIPISPISLEVYDKAEHFQHVPAWFQRQAITFEKLSSEIYIEFKFKKV